MASRKPGGAIRLLIADDHQLIREGLRSLLSLQPEFAIVGEARDAEEAVAMARDLVPDVLLLDYAMPGKSGLEVLRELNAAGVKVRALVLTAALAKADVLKMLRAGARGVILKDSPTELLCKSILKVHQGEVWIGRDVMGELLEQLGTRTDVAPPAPEDIKLTTREREVLRLVLEGLPNKEIARRLAIGADTVKHHLTSIFDKTGATNRSELALFALRHKIDKG
jgi:DNA-binding NarL/FixJ family response regulator